MRYKRFLILLLLSCSIWISFLSKGQSTDLDNIISLPSEAYSLEKITLSENSSKILNISPNGTISLYFLNESSTGVFLQSGVIFAFFSANISQNWEKNLSYTLLLEQYDLSLTKTSTSAYEIRFYLLLINDSDETVSLILRLDYTSLFFETLADLMRMGLIIVITIAILFMFIKSVQHKQEGELIRFKMLRGFAIGYSFGLINWLMWELDIWFNRELHRVFIPQLEVQGPWLPFSFNLIQILYLLLYSLTQMFVINEIEKNISQKKYPYLSHLILVGGIGVVIGFIFPIIFDFAFIFYCIIMLAGLFYFIRIFGSVARYSTGIIRWKAILIILGVLIPLIMGLTRGNMIPGQRDLSYFLADFLSVIALIFFYYGAI